MSFHNVKVVATSPDPSFWPDKKMPEVLFTGKSNTGKSSLINALCNKKNLAYVGSTPGKTRMLNFYEAEEGIRLVDAPGYGYARFDVRRPVDFEKLMRSYFDLRADNCRRVLVLLDCRREPDHDDELMIALAKHYHLPVWVVLTKTDKMKPEEKNARPAIVAKKLGVRDCDVILSSSQDLSGIEGLSERILALRKKKR